MDTNYQIMNDWVYITRDTFPADFSHDFLHYHHSYEMFIIENGKCNLLLDDKIIHASKYDIVLIRPDVLHKNNGGADRTRYAVHFTQKYLLHHFTPEITEQMTAVFKNNRITVKPVAFNRITELLRYAKKDPKFRYLHIGEIISILSNPENIERLQLQYSKDLVNSILEYINKNYAIITNLEDIALEFKISKSYLCQIFKKETAVTVAHYLNSVRINNACDMLRRGNTNITETALLCGYNSSMYFCKLFKQIVNMTPSEYKWYIQNSF